jgi:hypothetical protein
MVTRGGRPRRLPPLADVGPARTAPRPLGIAGRSAGSPGSAFAGLVMSVLGTPGGKLGTPGGKLGTPRLVRLAQVKDRSAVGGWLANQAERGDLRLVARRTGRSSSTSCPSRFGRLQRPDTPLRREAGSGVGGRAAPSPVVEARPARPVACRSVPAPQRTAGWPPCLRERENPTRSPVDSPTPPGMVRGRKVRLMIWKIVAQGRFYSAAGGGLSLVPWEG